MVNHGVRLMPILPNRNNSSFRVIFNIDVSVSECVYIAMSILV